MKVCHLSTDDFSGGASRAAYRIHMASLQTGLESDLRVLTKNSANIRVKAGKAPRTYRQKVVDCLTQKYQELRNRNWYTNNRIMHSFGTVSAGLVSELNTSDTDLLNLHWISNLLSIDDIGNLKKPIVWTLHDMWAFCGGEHVVPDETDARFRSGYRSNNRTLGERGPDLNRFAWEKKRQAWSHNDFTIITPGHWMASCARDSVLFSDAQIHVVPNPLEMRHLWRPIDKQYARAVLGLDQNKTYILSGSAGGMPVLKGEDLLRSAIEKLVHTQSTDVELLIFGQTKPINESPWGCPVHWLGRINDDHVMATVYSAADAMMVPSRQDNLPNTAVEAQACGTPVVAFDIGGLPDIVQHHQTGWLAQPFDVDDFARGITWVLKDRERHARLSDSARNFAVSKFSPEIVMKQYVEIYEQTIETHRSKK